MPAAWKMPPIIKVYEALGALGDGRVHLDDEHLARVSSSDGSKVYAVEISNHLREVASNDNASFWQGYLGYPAIAVLLARGLYRASGEITAGLAGIPWKSLNRQFRNDYAKTLAEVERLLRERGCDPAAVRAEADAVIAALHQLSPNRGARNRPPAEPPTRRRKRPSAE